MAPIAQVALLLGLPFVASAVQKRATPESFMLYAYGEGLGGLPMFNADGKCRNRLLESMLT